MSIKKLISDRAIVNSPAKRDFADDRIPEIGRAVEISSNNSRLARGDNFDLSREVFGILGIPVDAIDVKSVICAIRSAATSKKPFLLSTPNLNFLVTSQSDPEFRESLLLSDLCPVDGIPIVWIARLLGIPIKQRVAGSDIFEALRSCNGAQPCNVFLFGGPPAVAEAAAAVLNSESLGVRCVGHLYPGYGTIDEMSAQNVIDLINASQADFFVASLGAKKGQEWLIKNHDRLRIPVRSHLGAAINFQAGSLKRAPLWVRKFGFEWLWRIKEEPHLWRRYWADGKVLFSLMLTNVVPLAFSTQWRRIRPSKQSTFVIRSNEGDSSTEVTVKGEATADKVLDAMSCFLDALTTEKSIDVNVSGISVIDTRFFGLLLMLRKRLLHRGLALRFTGLTPRVRKSFRLNKFEFLLLPEAEQTDAAESLGELAAIEGCRA